jgi:hypothetical protein
MSWLVNCYGEDPDEYNLFHILPLDDLEMHEESEDCKCQPTRKAIDDVSTMVVHNSFDGREAFEMALKVLNIET